MVCISRIASNGLRRLAFDASPQAFLTCRISNYGMPTCVWSMGVKNQDVNSQFNVKPYYESTERAGSLIH
jgi:hypothetical protein